MNHQRVLRGSLAITMRHHLTTVPLARVGRAGFRMAVSRSVQRLPARRLLPPDRALAPFRQTTLNDSTWANAAGRKAGNGNVSQISRAPVQSKDKNPKRTAPVDPVASQQAAMRAIAKEALEYAMDSRGEASQSRTRPAYAKRGGASA